jgi:hypothetical protein
MEQSLFSNLGSEICINSDAWKTFIAATAHKQHTLSTDELVFRPLIDSARRELSRAVPLLCEEIEMEILVLYSCLSLFIVQGSCTSYNYTSHGFTSVPTDIPPNATEIILDKNKITIIQQSDFNERYPNLTALVIKSNAIASVELGSFRGTQLTDLDLLRNQLTEFPDLSEVNNTLKRVWLAQNKLRVVASSDIESLTLLEYLGLGKNLLATIPEEVKHLGMLARIGLQGNPLLCCRETAWLKAFDGLNTEECTRSRGTALEGKLWDDLTQADLEAEPCPIPVGSCREYTS